MTRASDLAEAVDLYTIREDACHAVGGHMVITRRSFRHYTARDYRQAWCERPGMAP